MLTTGVIDTISPNDGMFQGDRHHYFDTGRKAVEEIGRVVLDPREILDLPCGHGRVLRHLRAAFPEAHITACDIDTDGVDFCAQTFGASPLYGRPDPSEVECGRYDLIWCGSLLTHLDAPGWGRFLDFFAKHLYGVLVFTVLGQYARNLLELAYRTKVDGLPYEGGQAALGYFGVPVDQMKQMLDGYERSGFGYGEYTSQPGYGQAIASPVWVRRRVVGFDVISYRQRAWNPTQDVVAVTLRP